MVRVSSLMRALWLWLLVCLCSSASAQTDVSGDTPATWVIAHSSVPIDSMAVDELRSILLGNQKFWPGGQRIHLIIDGRYDSAARSIWIDQITEMSEVQFTQYWIGMVFKGRANSAPHTVPDRQTAVGLTSALPGAISVVEKGDLNGSVKQLHIVYDSNADP